jgi:hypothetical protein
LGNRIWRVRAVGDAVELDDAVEPFLKGSWMILRSGGDRLAILPLRGSSAGWEELKDCSPPPRSGWLAFSGEIGAATDQRVISAIRDRRPEGLVLDSTGGLREEAQRIGHWVRSSGMATKVDAGMQCLSECVFILAAGTPRAIDSGASIGLSRTLITKDLGVFRADQGAGGDSAVYFSKLGVDGGKLAVLATSSLGGEIHRLSRAELKEVGLVDTGLPDVAGNPLVSRRFAASDGGWWWLIGLLGLGVILRAGVLYWTGS